MRFWISLLGLRTYLFIMRELLEKLLLWLLIRGIVLFVVLQILYQVYTGYMSYSEELGRFGHE